MFGIIARQVELGYSRVPLAILACNEEPGFLGLALRIQEFELGVGNAAEFGIPIRRLGAVAKACNLHQALAGVDLFAQPAP